MRRLVIWNYSTITVVEEVSPILSREHTWRPVYFWGPPSRRGARQLIKKPCPLGHTPDIGGAVNVGPQHANHACMHRSCVMSCCTTCWTRARMHGCATLLPPRCCQGTWLWVVCRYGGSKKITCLIRNKRTAVPPNQSTCLLLKKFW